MSKHDISPSSLAKRFLCPGSLHAERDMPELPSAWAEYGTEMHKCWERLATGVELAHEYVKEMSLPEHKTIHEALDWTAEVIKTNVGSNLYKSLAEYKVDLSFMGGKELKEGTIDLLMYENFGEAQGYDWKFGNPSVSWELLEWQQKCYALGAMQKFGLTRFKGFTVFPLAKFIRNFEFVALEKDTYIKQCLEVEGRAFQDNAPRVSGQYQCSRCKAMGTCPAVYKHLRTDVHDAEKLPRFPDLLGRALQAKEAAPYVIQHAIELLTKGTKIPGWKLAVQETVRWKRGCKTEVLALITNEILPFVGVSYKRHFIGVGDTPRRPEDVFSTARVILGNSIGNSITKKFDAYVTVSKKTQLVRDAKGTSRFNDKILTEAAESVCIANPQWVPLEDESIPNTAEDDEDDGE